MICLFAEHNGNEIILCIQIYWKTTLILFGFHKSTHLLSNKINIIDLTFIKTIFKLKSYICFYITSY